jgi:hypothetical protein
MVWTGGGAAGAAAAGRKLLTFNTCPTLRPVFWNGWCFPNQFLANNAAAAAGDALYAH